MRCGEYQSSRYSEVFEKETEKYRKYNSSKIKKALKLFDLRENSKMLDIGCGDGFFAKLIGEKTKAEIFGLDISKSSVSKAVEKGINAKVFDIDGAKLPFEDGFFDAVFCGDTIEHIFDTDKLVKEVNRVLKPGGSFIVTVPNVNAWYNRFLMLFGYLPAWIEPTAGSYKGTPFFRWGCGHVRAFNRRVIKHFLEDRGFEIEKIKGAHIIGDKETSELGIKIWNSVDSFFARFSSISTFVIVKARKK